jgi:rhodanese-related sulfurtransferase
VLTGDSLFVNDVARPDLAIEEREGARNIFRSLKDKLLTLPDECEVWPAHLGGSMCGGPGMDMKISSTIGFERRHNPTLAIGREDDFVEQAVATLGPQPRRTRALRVGGRPHPRLGDRAVARHQGLPDDLDPSKPIAVVCASGQRAAVGASLLKRYGAHGVIHVIDGGVPRWKRLGLPVEQG